jgi:hypothetical protein
MKTNPRNVSVVKLAFFLGCASISLNTASATIVFDLQASGVDPSLGTLLDSKTVNVTGAGNIYLEVWAKITAASPGNNIFGVQALMGSIVSTTTGPGTAAGTMSAAAAAGPFNAAAQGGNVTELSSPADGVTDLGSNLTTPATDFIRFWKSNGIGGQNVNTVFFATNNVPAGATFNAIPNGYEFLMGSATLSLNNFTARYLSMNWAIPSFSGVGAFQIVSWTEGDGRANGTTTLEFLDKISVGTPVVITPEPASAALLLVGGALLGLRRRRQARSGGAAALRGY